jgi:hypothetical protein
MSGSSPIPSTSDEQRSGYNSVRVGKADLPVREAIGHSGPVLIVGRAAALLALAAAVSCSTSVSGTPAPSGAAPAAGAESAAPVNACTLLRPEEVQVLIGANDGGKGAPGAHSICTWTNADELSVTVDVAQPGTAVNGLPAWDPALGPERPLPDGMRSLSGGQVEFVAGTRDCAVQVVTDPTSKDDEQRAVALAKVVQSRL